MYYTIRAFFDKNVELSGFLCEITSGFDLSDCTKIITLLLIIEPESCLQCWASLYYMVHPKTVIFIINSSTSLRYWKPLLYFRPTCGSCLLVIRWKKMSFADNTRIAWCPGFPFVLTIFSLYSYNPGFSSFFINWEFMPTSIWTTRYTTTSFWHFKTLIFPYKTEK